VTRASDLLRKAEGQEDSKVRAILSRVNKETNLDIKYDGPQEDEKGNIVYHQFTIHGSTKPLKGATFVLSKVTYDNFVNKVNLVVGKFKKSL